MRDEGFQVWISFFGQHDLKGQVFVATLIASDAAPPALQPQSSPGLDLRYRHGHRAIGRRNGYPAA
jgi:hypothetical protein